MSVITRARLQVASAALVSLAGSPLPRGVFAAPRADANPSDPAAVIRALRGDVEGFRAEINAKVSAWDAADVVRNDKLEKISASVDTLQGLIDKLNAQAAAAAAGAGSESSNPLDVMANTPEEREYRKRFLAHFRQGERVDDDWVRSQQKAGPRAAMSVGSNPDGGYLAPVEWDRTITDRLKIVSPIRDLATVQNISTSGFVKVFNDRAVGSGWVGETAARPNTSNPGLTALTYTPGEIYANPMATQALLDDAVVDVEAWLAGEVETEFSRQEGIAFLTGNGVNKPRGLLTYTDSTHPFGPVPEVRSGAAAALTPDGIMALIYDLPSEYAQEARILANRATLAKVRGFKATDGQYLWQPSLQLGTPATLLGYGITEMGAMPNVAAGEIPMVFGNIRRAYVIVDRTGVRLLRDPFTNKPYVQFYTTKRVGGGMLDPTALRYLRVGANV